MKRIVLLLIAFCLSQITYSQTNIFPATGNVGIGTTTPSYPLEVKGGSLFLHGSNGGEGRLVMQLDGNNQFEWYPQASGLHCYNRTSANYIISFLNNGNVGIGTTTPQSLVKLDVRQSISNGNAIAGYVYDGTGSSTTATIGVGYATSGSGIITGIEGNSQGTRTAGTNIGGYFWASGAVNNYALITGGGNVGIGTTTPNGKLDILSSPTDRIILGGSGFDTNSNSPKLSLFGRSGLVTGVSLQAISTGGWGGHRLAIFQHPSTAGDYTTENEVFSILDNGNIGIGTTNPQYKLAVKGTIGCGEVKVEVVTGWSDFVFHPTYKLRTLGEVEQFIKANNHLPEIPTESEVKQNGIGLGEMNAKLLQKIEELTLYMIEQNKKIVRVEEQNNLLMKEVEQLKAK